MNRLITPVLVISLSGLMMASNCHHYYLREAYVDAKFFFINQTQDTVSISGNCNYDDFPRGTDSLHIFPGDTLILHVTDKLADYDRRKSNGINIDNYPTPPGGLGCRITYGKSGRCDRVDFDNLVSFFNIQSYEIRKEVSKHNFEFTYFMTDAKKAKVRDCLPVE